MTEYLEALSQFLAYLFDILVADGLQLRYLTQHLFFLLVAFIQPVIESFVHGLLGFAEPRQQIGVQLHLFLKICEIEVVFSVRKLLENPLYVLFVHRYGVAESCGPHLGEALNNDLKISQTDLALLLFVQQIERLLHFLLTGAV